MSIRGQVGNGTGGKSLPQGSAFFLGCQSRAGRRQRGLPTSPLQSQVTEEKTHPGPTAARQSCWKGKYLGIALPRGWRGAGDREGGLLSLDTGTPRTAPDTQLHIPKRSQSSGHPPQRSECHHPPCRAFCPRSRGSGCPHPRGASFSTPGPGDERQGCAVKLFSLQETSAKPQAARRTRRCSENTLPRGKKF